MGLAHGPEAYVMAAQGRQAKMPTTAETYDRGVRWEREQILKLLRAYRSSLDEKREAQARGAVERMIWEIERR